MEKNENSNVEAIYGLSNLQEGILYECLMNEDNLKYILQYTLEDINDITIATKCMNLLKQKYEVVRSNIIYEKISKPTQVILKSKNLEYEIINLNELDDNILERIYSEERNRKFNLQENALLRIKYIQSPNKTIMLWTIHHIILDGWSVKILMNDFTTYYNELVLSSDVDGCEKILYEKIYEETNKLSINNYNNWAKRQDHSKEITYWKSLFDGYDSSKSNGIVSKTSYPDESVDSMKYELSGILYKKIEECRNRCKVTSSTIFESAWGVLLQKYMNSDDVIFGKVVSGRNELIANSDKLVGMFVNTVPVRTDNSRNLSITDLLDNMNNQSMEANQYSYCSLADIQSMYNNKNLISTLLVVENYDDSSADNNKYVHKLVYEYIAYPLCIFINQKTVKIVYDRKIYDPVFISKLANDYTRTLEFISSKKEKNIDDIELVTDEEKYTILNIFNHQIDKINNNSSVINIYEEQVRQTPDKIALYTDKGTYSYADINHYANQVAAKLIEKNIGTNDFVVMLTKRSMEMIAGIFGVLKAGAAYIPVTVDTPKERIEYIINDSAAKAILCFGTDSFSDRENAIQLENIDLFDELLENPHVTYGDDDIVYCIYTSGTTGAPKGVMNMHKGLMNRLIWMKDHYNFSEKDIVLQKTTYTFDVSVWEILLWSISGASLCLLPDKAEKDPETICNTIADNNVTIAHFVPSMLNMFLAYIKFNRTLVNKISSLRQIFCSGEALSIETVNQFKQLTRDLNCKIANLYGPTEASIDVTYYDFDQNLYIVPIGKPIDNIKIFILNKNKLCGIGIPGEICIAGIGIAKGYLNQAKLTQAKFIDNPYGEGKLYLTGDLGRWLIDGNIEYLGRMDDQIKIRGFRVELSEIENELRRIPYIKDCAVIANNDRNNDKAIHAFIVSDQKIDKTDIKDILLGKLPDYMIPTYIQQIDQIPVTANGKLNRRALPDIIMNSDKIYEGPNNQIEEMLCRAYEEILQVERVGINDDFFELGGHSLKVIRLLNKIEKEIRIHLSVKEIFNHSVIRKLAKEISNKKEVEVGPIPQTVKKNYYPMSSAQKRIYMVYKMDEESLAYNMPKVIKVEGVLDSKKVKDVLERMCERHEILRTEFMDSEDGLVQHILDDINIDYTYLDASVKQDNLIINAFIQPFLLGHAPLFRVELVNKKEYSLILIDFHHIINDGISYEVFIQEFIELYEGKKLVMPKLQYRDYSEWMRHKDITGEKEYWKKELGGELPSLSLPTDYKRPNNQSFIGETIETSIESDLATEIQKLARKSGTTEYMIFLSTFMILMAKYSNRNEVIIGTVAEGRTNRSLEDMLGMYVNTLAMKANPEKDKVFIDFLQEIKTKCIDAYDNQNYPYDELVKELGAKTYSSHNPIFDVMLMMENEDSTQYIIDGKAMSFIPVEDKIKISKFDLTFNVINVKSEYKIKVEYNTALFKQETIKSIAQHYNLLLSEITNNDRIKIGGIDLVTKDELHLIINTFNNTDRAIPQNKLLIQLFEEQVNKTPNHIAVKYENQEITYEELNKKANQLARKLIALGIKTNDYVAFILDRSIEMFITIYGILKTGGIYVPISVSYPESRKNFIISDSKAKLLITNKDNMADYNVDVLNICDNTIFEGDFSNLLYNVDVNKLIYCTYTSGTTGTPKGIPASNLSVLNLALWYKEYFKINTDTKNILISSISFDLCARNIFGIHLSGGCVCLCGTEKIFDTNKIVSFIETEKISLINCAASAFYAILAEAKQQEYIKLCSLKNIYLVGEALSYSELEKFMQSYNCNSQIVNGYGPTEDTGISTAYTVTSKDKELYNISIGKPLNNKQIYILDNNHLCGVGIVGEICICGMGVSGGYLNNDELTKSKFFANPFGTGRMFRTGDYGRWLPDGNIIYLGRSDDQVKINGVRIELSGLESLVNDIDYVSDCIVITKQDEEENKSIYLYVISSTENAPHKIRKYLKKKLPDYMLPKKIYQIDSIPLTQNGKVDRKALLEIKDEVKDNIVLPQNEMEASLCDIFKKVLKTDKISTQADLFELGLQSLGVIRAINLIYEVTGKKIKIKEMFKASSIVQLGQLLVDETCPNKEEYQSIPIVQKQPMYFMSSTQKRTYLVYKMAENSLAYNMPFVYSLKGSVGKEKIERSLQTLINRHEILRTRFIVKDGELLQEVCEHVKMDFLYVESDTQDDSSIIKDFVQPFVLECPPLIRARLVNKVDHYLLLLGKH